MKTISFLKWACIVSMFAWVNVAQAQEKATTAGNWDPSKTSGEYTLNGNFEVTQVIVLTGDLTINAGSAPHSITRKFTDTNTNGFGGIFRTGNHKLTINGTASAKIYIDGGAVYNTPHDARTGFKSGYKGHGIFVDTGGSIHLKYVHIRNCCVNKSLGFPACDGGGIFFKCETTGYYNSTLTDCTISGCYAVSGSAVKFSHTDHTNATFTRVWFYNNFTQSLDGSLDGSGGTIRSNGSCSSILVMDNCTMEQNRSLNGGGILWNAGGASGTKLTIKGHTRIHHNVADIRGGGIQLNTKLDLQSAVIYNNTAQYGGGIFIEPYTAFNEHMEGYGVNLTITAQDTIKNNTASNIGGGIYLNIVQCEEVGFNQSGTPIANPNHTFNMQGGVITGNQACQGAGIAILDNAAKKNKHNGVYSNEVKRWVYISGGQIYNNYSPQNGASVRGGGLYIVKHVNTGLNYAEYGGAGTITLNASGGKIYSNHANNGLGGGIYMGNQFSSSVDSHVIVNVSGSVEVYDNTSDGDGGGIYISGGDFTMTGGVVGKTGQPNICTGGHGGGVAVLGGNINISGGNISYNQSKKSTGNAGGFGGGFYLSNGNVIINGGTISSNTAPEGGGFFVSNGSVTVTGATISDNVSTTGHGGAFDIANGDLTVSNTSITGNNAPNGNGGGAYVGNGDIVFNAGTTVTNNNAINGGGLYVGGGSITYNNGEISHNAATGNGGGIYANADVAFNGGTVSENTAVSGGGLYANAGTVDFSSGMFSQNGASANGGGIYLNTGATLNLTNEATITQNHVPANGAGGGVYLGGTLNVGRNAADLPGTHSLMAHDNYAGTPSDYVLNNIFLPNETKFITLLSDISGINPGTGYYYTRLGFSVTRGFCPVVYTDISGGNASHEAWLASLMGSSTTLTGAIFDDANKYPALHMPEDHGPILAKYIWLWGCWTTEVTSNPGPDHFTVDNEGTDAALVHIKSNRGLAWFTSYVNGLNNCDQHHNVDAVLEADVDMSEFLWVPIGAVSAATVDPTTHSTIFTDGGFYGGEFDGHGHTIEGLQCFYLNAIPKIGLFGYLNNGTVKNTFINDYWFMSTYSDETYHIGGIAGIAQGDARISNSEAHGRIETEVCKSGTSMGGLVGLMEDNAEIHSSIAIPEMSGNAAYVGGIAGKTNTGNALRNSFANLKLGSTASVTGGLVGTNAGTVENCYVRLQGTTKPAYWFAATNTGNIRYCYAPEGESNYAPTGGTLEGLGTYGLTQLPYLYKHRDTQVDANNDYVPTGTDADKQLMIVLNNWVEAPAQASGNYTKWGRPWQESNAQKPLNDDYPILKMPMAEAVAAKAGDPYLYYNPVDSLLVRCTDAESAIWVYRNPSDTVRGDNSTSAAKLYIAEDVVLLNDNPLKAYVGITLDNSAGAGGAYPTYFPGVPDATDWHMIATPLSDAPIGINYDNGTYDFDYGHPSGMPYYLFYPKDDAKHGYFPSHRFGKEYPGSAATIEPGNYYQEWDFYSYYEPEYHWINFKRNSASHHHMEAENHSSIVYDNETRLVPGKGYFAATREETFLQCQGHLNNGAVAYNLTQTSGVPRHGYNLIGNPYQAYLNFDDFADANSGSGDNKIWTVAQNASYTILDEDEPETSTNVETVMGVKPVFYRTYLYGSSTNPDVSAGGFIHPHQGFFVRLEGNKASAQAQFAPGQRNVTAKSKFRGNDHIDYPLVNLFAIEEDGAADVVTVELCRPDEGGAALMQSLRVGNGKIWCHYNDKDYAIAYTQPGITEVGIRFETVEDTEYTMRWSTRNGDFSYLHLIDNKTGADVDCLTTDEYKFSASTSDYKSRFRLVFGYTGIEEPEAEANENFAFMMNDALVVTGEGVLQVFDMTGRMVASQELHGVQTTVSLPNAANGVYVLRLTNGRQSQVQKMVISK